MSQLILMRHGQAAFGAERYDQLSQRGLAQVRATAEHLKALGCILKCVHSGSKQRHRSSAKEVMTLLGCEELAIEDALDEFSDSEPILASIESRTGINLNDPDAISYEDKLQLYGEHIRLWTTGVASIEGAPTAAAFRDRIRSWLDGLAHDHAAEDVQLAVTSTGVIANVVCEILRLPESALWSVMSVIQNASLSTILLGANGTKVLESFNSVGHVNPAIRSVI